MFFEKEDTPSLVDRTLKESELKKPTQEELDSFFKKINKRRESRPWSYPIVIKNVYFENISLENVCLEDIRFVNSKFKGCEIMDSDLAKAEFKDVIFEDVAFFHNDMRAIGFFNTQLKEVDIEKCAMLDCGFKSVSFEDVYIYSSNLDGSALRESNFSDVSLQNVFGTYSACPEEGSFIGFKKLCDKERYETLICKLEIPADAKRSSAFSRKCRCSKAKVLEILGMDNENKFTIPVKKGYSTHEPAFEYKVGEMVYPDSFDEDRWNECSSGIHFFITKQEAINY